MVLGITLLVYPEKVFRRLRFRRLSLSGIKGARGTPDCLKSAGHVSSLF